MTIKSLVTFLIIHLLFLWKNSYVAGSTSSLVYLGCFQVQPQQTLGGWNSMSTSMTIETCKDFCSTDKFCGVQQSDQCFCGNSLPTNIIKPEGECNMTCSGNEHQIFGGIDKMDIFINPDYKEKHDPMSLGCYKDQPIRTLTGKHIRSTSMTIETCKDICTKEDTLFYGLQDSDQCSCGDSLTTNIPRPERECNISCSGNRQDICGGTGRINIYLNPFYKINSGCYELRPLFIVNLARRHIRSRSVTIENCKNFCVKKNTQFYGLYRTRCFCGNSLTTNRRPKWECNIKCRGEDEKGCGSRIQIFRNPDYTLDADKKSV